jgi:predicted PurR-regulated permease PerM
MPIFIALFFWYLINSIAHGYNKLINKHNKRWIRWVSLGLSLFTFAALITLLIYGIRTNVESLIDAAPRYQQNLQQLIARIVNLLNIEGAINVKSLMNMINLPKAISYIGGGLANLVTNAGLVIAYIVFLFIEQNNFKHKINIILNKYHKKKKLKYNRIMTRINQKVKKFLSVKTFLSAMGALFSFVFMRYVNLDFATFWAVLMFVMGFIPTFGAIISTVFPSVIALLQFDSLMPFIIVLGGSASAQILFGNILEPKMMGDTLNMSPLLIMIALVFWGTVWGIVGMFLGVPLMVIVTLILAEIKKTEPIAILFSQNGEI